MNARRTQQVLVGALGVGVLLLVIVFATGGGKPTRPLAFTTADATDMVGGQYVKEGGVNVGTVKSVKAVDGGHLARVVLNIDTDQLPLPGGTKLTLKWGGTVSFVNRYVLITRGAGPGTVGADGTLPSADFNSPTEFDSFVNTFNQRTRTNLKSFLANAGVTLKDASPSLRRAIEAAPPALGQVSDVLGDLDDNESALKGLVDNGAQVMGAVNRADPGIQPLVTGAATTFSALATKTQQLASTLKTAPSTFTQVRQTLAAAEPTLNLAKSVTAKIGPGVDQVDRIATPLDQLLVTLKNVGPDAITALKATRAATPSLNPLLTKATAQLPQVKSISRQAVTSLDCVRPYTPDIIAFATDWGDFLSGVNGKDHYFRAQVQTLIPAPINDEAYNSATMVKRLPWISYVYPPAPGFAAGQPWYLAQCNEGPSTQDPNQDPENDGTKAELPAASATPISLPETSSK